MECKVYRFTGLENNDSIIDKKNHAPRGQNSHPLADLFAQLLAQLLARPLINRLIPPLVYLLSRPSRASPGGGNHVDHRIHTA